VQDATDTSSLRLLVVEGDKVGASEIGDGPDVKSECPITLGIRGCEVRLLKMSVTMTEAELES